MRLSARYINWLAHDLQMKILSCGQEPPKFKFLVRTPSYRPVLQQFQGFNGFECRMIGNFNQSDPDGYGAFHHMNTLESLEHENPVVANAITTMTTGEFEYTIGYLDISPCNPSGYVRSMEEAKEIAHVLGLAKFANMAFLAKVFDGTISYKREPFVLVEDHIYRGLEYDGNKTASFCQIDDDVLRWDKVTHMFSVSPNMDWLACAAA